MFGVSFSLDKATELLKELGIEVVPNTARRCPACPGMLSHVVLAADYETKYRAFYQCTRCGHFYREHGSGMLEAIQGYYLEAFVKSKWNLKE